MNTLIRVISCALLCAGHALATPPTDWVDPDTGHRVIRLSIEAGTRSLYFHQNSVTPDGRFVIVDSDQGIKAIELATRKNTLVVPGRFRTLFVGRKSGLIYYSAGAATTGADQSAGREIYTVKPTGGKPKELATVERGTIGSVNADETLLLGVYAEREWQLEQGPRDPRFDANYQATGKDGKALSFAEAKEVRLLQREQARIPMALFTIDTKTGERKIIHESTDWLNHLQFSPTVPDELMFCHEGPWHRVDRVWRLKLGGKPQLVHKRTMNMEIAGHEFFDVDGKTIWYDLQTPRGEDFWLASSTAEGRRTWYHLERDLWSVHFNMSPDGKVFSGDGGDEQMVAHAKNGKWLYLFRPQVIPDVAGISAPNSESLIHPGTLVPEKLVNMQAHDYRLEPNMFFTIDGRWIVFRSNMHGEVHTYMVEVAKAR